MAGHQSRETGLDNFRCGERPSSRDKVGGLLTPAAGLYLQRARYRAIHVCVRVRVSPVGSAVAGILLGEGILVAALASSHGVLYKRLYSWRSVLVLCSFFPRLGVLFSFRMISAKFCRSEVVV